MAKAYSIYFVSWPLRCFLEWYAHRRLRCMVVKVKSRLSPPGVLGRPSPQAGGPLPECPGRPQAPISRPATEGRFPPAITSRPTMAVAWLRERRGTCRPPGQGLATEVTVGPGIRVQVSGLSRA